ncbi:uncharacterized protein LOC119027303 isoform X2 [Acanthopagrus latus]|uniref:uncharacterized protein LOC119027303 isoform X2 n=1 Tax=Acanthopagrus latus TaxID=8177 RepID=UPI00187C686B|nr:uncharacterized protein LOC119027303 isoform X2 [Acanthopagrus latus]
MDEYQHPLYFEARDLTDKEERKVWRHFHKRRVSGGGDCRMIEKDGANTYKICFKEKEDQERVIQRKFHTISLPARKLRLTVSRISLPQNSDQPSSNQSQVPDQEVKSGATQNDTELKFHTISLPSGEPGLTSGRIILPQNPNQPSTSPSRGPDQEVKSGATQLDELIKTLKEKRVKLPTALLTFITSSDAISKFQARFQQNLCFPVSIEVGSDLVLSSVSTDALDEAEATIKRELSLDNVQLQGAAAAPPDLDRVKEILMKAKNDANLRELRVDVSFIPGPSGAAATKVQLVGYSDNVNKLKEILHNYQMNQVWIKELLKLPHPELVECFDQFLDLIGMKQNKVTFKTSRFPSPSVLVTGPRCLVPDVQANLKATLASLMKDTLVLDGPGAQRYFQAEGKVSKELVESSCRVIIREQQGVFSPEVKNSSTSRARPKPAPRQRHSTPLSIVFGKMSLEIKLGSLVDEKMKVLVAPMINRQLNSTNIGECLLKRAGITLKSKFYLAAANRTFAPGDIVQVDAPPSLGCSKLFFIECLPWDGVGGQSVQALGKGLKRCLDLCAEQNLCSVAFPVIGPGTVLEYPLREAIQVLTENICQFGSSASSGSLSAIHIVIESGYPDSEECYHEVYRHLSLNINQGSKVPQSTQGQQQQQSSLSVSTDLHTTLTSQKSVFLFLGLSKKDVDDAMTKLKDLYQVQCSIQTLKKGELTGLIPHQKENVKQLVEKQDLVKQTDQLGRDSSTTSGLKDEVNQVTQKTNAAGGVVGAQGTKWSVDVQRLEATRQITGHTAKLQQLVNPQGKYLGDRVKKIRRNFQSRQDGGADCRAIEKAGAKTYQICVKDKKDLKSNQTNLPQKPDQPSISRSKGPDQEVKSGATQLDELIKTVKEKRVKLPTVLLTFITSSGAISKFQARFQQNLRFPVSIEVGSDLVLSSVSTDALDEAEATIKRELSLDNVQLQGAAAAPPDLDRVKEILMKEKNEANFRELRVDVSFIPGPSGAAATKVRLVGYSDNVNKLKEILHNNQRNQGQMTKELLKLPHPELVDYFDQFLDLIGMKQNKVTFKTSRFPSPSVLVTGPRCLVPNIQANLKATLVSLMKDTLVLDGPGAQRYFQAEGKVSKELVESSCRVIIREQQGVFSPEVKSFSTSSVRTKPATRQRCNTPSSILFHKMSLEIKLGSLVDEQVNVLVAPMINRQLNSTEIGKCLLKKAGNAISSMFYLKTANRTFAPGDVLQVDAPPSLGCSKLFFIECSPWDGVSGWSVQALQKGLKRCLNLCAQQHLCSVAFPVIGPGRVLKYPLSEAIQVLTETLHQFGLSAVSDCLSTIHIVIKPGYPDSEECYHDVSRHLSLNMNQEGQAIFRSLTSDLDDITMTVGGGAKLQLVFGDITNETTDIVVNTTNFVDFDRDGVCKDILAVAGPEVEAELRAANNKRRSSIVSRPGWFNCKAIWHVSGKGDAGTIEQRVCDIIRYCENYGYKSVAIPAISAGAGGLDPGVVASAILRGVKIATSYTSFYHFTNIRLVLIKINVFLAFKEEAMQMFSTAVINRVSVPQRPHVQQQQQQQPPSLSASTDLSILHSTSTSQKSVFLFLGLSRQDVDDAMTMLMGLYQAQCSTQTIKKEELVGLTQDDVEVLKQVVETQGLHIQRDQSGPGSLTVSGLKDGVNQVMQKINASLQVSLRREVRVREEQEFYTLVAWYILAHNGNWERLPKKANYSLENNDIGGGIVDAQGVLWSVDAQRLEASTRVSGQTTKLKRLVNLPDFTLPLYWDSMTHGEAFKAVALQPSSAEYKSVKEAFKRTVSKTVMKIERLQNIHLRKSYEVQKKHISDNRRQVGGAREKLLYHGTTRDNCDSIMKTGFNRSFAGQNGTSCGHGTYFAVNASYSAQPTFSKPAADGSQLVFVARVLTGVSTLGSSDMKVPPPRSNSQPHDRCDSVVDRIDNPKMYVVFHDNQAYPDYLITFR